MRHLLITFLSMALIATGLANAQAPRLLASAASNDGLALPAFSTSDGSVPASALVNSAGHAEPALPLPIAMPRMAPELALQAWQRHSALQAAELASYSASTLIRAELPDTSQYGEFEVQRHYAAPRSLEFKAVRYTGDGFVKSNVITRLLQSEVDHVQKDEPSRTAITPANYKFSYKGATQIDGRLAHVYQVKPRKKRAGLFKGRVFLDAHTGSLVRAEGAVVKSPSFFIKKIEFVQDYADFGRFTFPVHMHSEARTRILGRAIVDIYHRNYQPVAASVQSAQQVPAL